MTSQTRPLTPAHEERLRLLAGNYGEARARQFVGAPSFDERRELDRAADKAWADFLRELHALVDWSKP